MSRKFKNPHYQPPKDRSENLELYVSAVKNTVSQLCKEPSFMSDNLSQDEKIALKSLQNRQDIVIHQADKGGKIVILNKEDYVQGCEKLLSDEKFYEKKD